jgi:hypothetical protein
MPEFSQAGFLALLQALAAAGYRFARFDQPAAAPGERVVFLRFDVDISPGDARELGRLVHERGLVANFFFQLNAEIYTLLASATLEVIEELRRWGHGVGLHIDETLLGDDETVMVRTLDWFGSCIAPVDRMISFHRPRAAVLGRSYSRLVSAYDPRFFDPERYLSDSRRSLAFWPRLQSWITEGRSPLQLLLHPVWWSGQEVPEILQALRARRAADLDRYVAENFGRVFGHLLADRG